MSTAILETPAWARQCFESCQLGEVSVPATAKALARTATVTLRYGEVLIPLSTVLTPWLKEHRPTEPLRGGVVELLETNPPKGVKPIRWVLYTDTPVKSRAQANTAIERYEQRPQIEDYHKAVKTGCGVERRQLKTAERLERAAALSAVVAVLIDVPEFGRGQQSLTIRG